MTIRLYSFGKRLNSTKLPAAADLVTTLTGELRERCSINTPQIVINVPSGVDLITDSVNYAYILDFGRWYWITEIVLIADKLAELQLTEDTMAFLRTSIGNSTQYVARASALKNGWITDSMYPVTNNSIIYTDDLTAQLPWSMLVPGDIGEGYYVIGLINKDPDAIGAASYYVMDQTGFADFRDVLFSTTNYTNMSFAEISEPLYKSLWNPLQYVVSCVWFPLKPPTAPLNSLTLDLGFFSIIPLAGHVWFLADSTGTYTSSAMNTYNHPQLSEGNYYNAPPFTQRKLIIQPYGEIDIDSSRIYGINHTIKIRTWIDFVTGDSVLRVIDTSNSDTILGGSSGRLGVPIQLAQLTQNNAPAGFMARGLSAALDKISADPLGIKSAASAILDAPACKINISTAGSSNGSLLNCVVTPIYEVRFFIGTSQDYQRFGAPLCDTKQISTLSANGGYIQCINARLSVPGAYESELREAEAIMNSGFYYE